MPTQTPDETPDPQEQIEVVYPDGRRGTMSAQAWRERDPALGIRRAEAPDESEPGELVNEVTPTNQPDA
jgi:hypothetical protein